MVVLRIVSGVVGLLLIGYIMVDIAREQQGPPEVLMYEKGTYLGQKEQPLDADTRAQIRSRGLQASSW